MPPSREEDILRNTSSFARFTPKLPPLGVGGSGLFHLNICGTCGRQFKINLWVVVDCKKLNLWWVAFIRKLFLWVVMEIEDKFLIKIASMGGYEARG